MAAPLAAHVTLIGLTGGLGSGKSTALAQFAKLGAATLSTDAVVHELLDTAEVREAIVAHFGPEVLGDGAIVDRRALASAAFDSDGARRWLEQLLWPRVADRVQAWRAEIDAADPRPTAAVVETPLLFEAGMGAAYDHTVAVVAEEAVRETRASARGHVAVPERAAAQLTQEQKAERADFVVRNDGSVEELRAELSKLLAKMGVEA